MLAAAMSCGCVEVERWAGQAKGCDAGMHKRAQHQDFERGLPPYYYSGPTQLSFRERTGSGVVCVVWPCPAVRRRNTPYIPLTPPTLGGHEALMAWPVATSREFRSRLSMLGGLQVTARPPSQPATPHTATAHIHRSTSACVPLAACLGGPAVQNEL